VHRRALLLAVVVSELLVAGLLVHVPDIGAALGFLGGGYPTAMTVLAAASLLIWVALLATAGLLIASLLVRGAARVAPQQLVLASVLAGSLAMLGFGVMRHLEASYSMCCGSVSQARQQLDAGP